MSNADSFSKGIAMRRTVLATVLALLAASACSASDGKEATNDVESTESFVSNWLVLGMFENPAVIHE